MKRFIASIAIIPILWWVAYPSGKEFCKSHSRYRSATDTEADYKATKDGTKKFCRLVRENPRKA